ncbi:MAG TPA: hypothetical protein DDZ80_11760 [Cyanobacteria bacterium UBA8803]|nr:hypothetical protein [Cyanobacteria bacterium UBA9273]HBL59159.1 hypothetical protein [Cyanobacteria bacterium UBA8803]
MILNNRYQVIRVLGSGGFGQTFLAEDTYMPSKRLCVLKQLKPIANDLEYYQAVQERFQREAAVLETLGESHNQIPTLYAYFEEKGCFYLVQEWIEGQTLGEKLQTEGPLSGAVVKEILIGILPVLEYIHSRNIIHRDIKPDNIILRKKDGKPVLIDFGAVKEAMSRAINSQGHVTRSIVVGTLGFMASEQAAGRPVYSSDLYSLGMTAIRLLTGKLFKDIETNSRTGEMLWRPHAPNVSDTLAAIIEKATQCHHSDRYATVAGMLNALKATNQATLPFGTSVTLPEHLNPSSYGDRTPAVVAEPPQLDINLKHWLLLTYQSALSRLPRLGTDFYPTQIKHSLSTIEKTLLIGGAIVFLGLAGSAGIANLRSSPEKLVVSRAEENLVDSSKQLVSTLVEENSPETNNDSVFTSADSSSLQNADGEIFQRGKDKYQRGDYSGAIEDFNQVLTLVPDHPETYILRGLARYRLDDTKGAVEDFRQASLLDPKAAAPYNHLGNVQLKIGEVKDALENLNQALRLDPKYAEAYKNRGDARAKLGDTQGALKDYNQALLINPKYADAYNNRGDIRTKLGDHTGAINDYNQAVSSNNNYAISYKKIGNIQAQLGDKKAAIAAYQKAAELYLKQGETSLYKETTEKLKNLLK